MKKSKKQTTEQISFLSLVKSLRLPVAQKTGQVFKSKKEYNRKDKRWKNEIE